MISNVNTSTLVRRTTTMVKLVEARVLIVDGPTFWSPSSYFGIREMCSCLFWHGAQAMESWPVPVATQVKRLFAWSLSLSLPGCLVEPGRAIRKCRCRSRSPTFLFNIRWRSTRNEIQKSFNRVQGTWHNGLGYNGPKWNQV